MRTRSYAIEDVKFILRVEDLSVVEWEEIERKRIEKIKTKMERVDVA